MQIRPEPAQGDERIPALDARGIFKRFGSVVALEGAEFEVYPGEIAAMIGDNGAGKSTLIKILAGALRPDSGVVRVKGREVHFHSPRDARNAGIETVYQDLALAPDLDIAANLYLGRELKYGGLLGLLDVYDQRSMRQQAAKHLKELRVNVRSIRQTVNTLSGGQRQSVAVARAVLWGKDVVILDEPTAALGVAQSGMVLDLMKRIRDQGTAVIFVSHNMPHVWEVADRIIVLRRGSRVGTLFPQDNMDQAVSLMTGVATHTGYSSTATVARHTAD
jgi:ABC-type sugar transport system ATPase subunit